MVSRDSRTPPSRQIAAAIRQKIASGELRPGARVPSVITLAGEYQVSPDTARKAIRLLKAEGLVETEPGYGTFVAES
jgi:GntR family transcriptional regulator